MADRTDNPRAERPRPRHGWPLAATLLAAAIGVPSAVAQQGKLVVKFKGTTEVVKASRPIGLKPAAVIAVPNPTVINFDPAEVGVTTAAAQTLTAMFEVQGFTTDNYTPTAALHYGLSYNLGTTAISCTFVAAPGPEDCTVNVTFQPVYPGTRPDALLLMDGTNIISTVQIYGLGESPMALIQPGIVTTPVTTGGYYYGSVVGEDGTVYIVSQNLGAVFQLTTTGVLSQLPIPAVSGPYYGAETIALDGAGVLYISVNNYSNSVFTYNTTTGVAGSVDVNPLPAYKPCQNSNFGNLEFPSVVATGLANDIFVYENLCNNIYHFQTDGTYLGENTLNPTFPGLQDMIVDNSGNVFVGGYAINEITPGGVQTQVNTIGANDGIQVDAADTLYPTRYDGFDGGVGMLAAVDYTTVIARLDPTAQPLGVGLGGDGTVYDGNYQMLDKIDRSQGALFFGTQTIGNTSGVMSVQVYNGGNQPLTLANIYVDATGTGNGFALAAPGSGPCSNGTVLAPGAICNIGVDITPVHAGVLTGYVDVVSNSLNGASATQPIALNANVVGIWVTLSPTVVNFPYQPPGTISGLMKVTATNNGYMATATWDTGPNYSDPQFTLPVPPVNGCINVSLAPGASCDMYVQFAPTSAGNFVGHITFSESSSQGGPDQDLLIIAQGTSMLPIIPINITENIKEADKDQVLLPLYIPILENIGVTAATPAPELSASIKIIENTTVTDTFVPPATIPIIETMTVTDTYTAPATIAIVETTTVTDTVTSKVTSLTVPVITWSSPAPIMYGTPLSGTQLNATTTVPGKFVYTPAAGTVLGSGPQILSVVFTPNDTADYAPNNDTIELFVEQVTSIINWVPASNVVSPGSPLGSGILDATSTTPGNITYTASQGGAPFTVTPATVLAPGHYTLTATLTPNDPTDYTAATVTQGLIVQRNVLTVTAGSSSRNFGTANPALTYTVTGFVGTDTSAILSGAPVLSTTAMLNSFGGSYPINVSQGTLTAPSDYTFNFVPGTLSINGGEPQTITFDLPIAIADFWPPFELTAYSTSGLPITYAIVSGGGSISGSVFTIAGEGHVIISASQAGNGTFAPAVTVTKEVFFAP